MKADCICQMIYYLHAVCLVKLLSLCCQVIFLQQMVILNDIIKL